MIPLSIHSRTAKNDLLIFTALVLSGLAFTSAIRGQLDNRAAPAARFEQSRQVAPPSVAEQVREMLNHD